MRLNPKNREGRCYELAWRYLIEDERYCHGWKLVQGEVQRRTDRFRFGHAWLISDDDTRVYDPCLDQQLAASDYISIFNASANLKCTPRQAAELILTHGHFGPWRAVRRLVEIGLKVRK
jgi:hypothetical protein